MHPSHEINKIYRVKVKDYSDEALEKLKRPVTLDGYKISPPQVRLISSDCQSSSAELKITIHEGRNRQIRRMCAIAGMRVTRLLRVQEGNLSLGDLPSGKWRYLSKDEVKTLVG